MGDLTQYFLYFPLDPVLRVSHDVQWDYMLGFGSPGLGFPIISQSQFEAAI